jgi:urea-proton symporter
MGELVLFAATSWCFNVDPLIRKTMAAVLPESYGYLIVLGIGGLLAVVVTILIKAELKWLGTKNNIEWFSTAGRNIKTGLIAASVVSAWTWAATLLQSSTVAYQFGIAGPFWYAAGASIQIIIFGVIAVGIKRRSPSAHTFPEIIKNRFGKGAHKVFLSFALLTNTVVTSMLVLGGAAVINALTGIDIYLAALMIPISIIIYTFFGGLKGTFIADYVNTAVLFSVVLAFALMIYFSSPSIGGISGMYEKLTGAAVLRPVEGNSLGSYLTMASIGALAFGIINIIGNFGTVFVDQSYWLRAIAARPIAAAKGYLMGGLAWFAIPFTLASTLGLAAVAMNIHLTAEEVSQGLVAPNAAYAILGDAGAIVLLAILFTAVTSAGSAQLTAVSTLGTYDIYKTYLRPATSEQELLKKSKLIIVVFGFGMALLAILLVQIGASLQYVYLVMGILIGSAVVPVALCLLWDRTEKYSAVLGAISGLAGGLAIWLGYSALVYGEISIRSTGNDIPLLLGNVTSISIGAIVCILGSMLFKRTKPLITTQTPLAAEKENNYPVVANEILTKASKVAKRYALLFSAVLVLVWPLPLFVSGYVLSEFDFHLWIILAISWTLIAGSSTIILPILESREGIAKIVQNAIIPIIFTGIVIIAVVSSWYMYNYETAQRSAISQLVQERLDASDIKTTLISSIEKQGSYTFSFIWSILGIVGTFAVIVVILDSKLRRLVLFQTRELLKANEELVKKDRLKEEFVNVAAHELRTPIQPILMLSELAIKGLLEPGMAVNKILQEAKRLRQLTDDILDVSKIETGNIEYRLEVFDITELLSSIIEKMKLQLTGGVLIETRFDTRVAIITADKSRLTQVFTNIIGNAMKYTTSGFIKVETSHLALSGNLRIEVKDTGPGIPAELVPRLFEKFATKDIDNKNRQGTGLGLFICKKIVEHHSGMIEAYNNIDGGATFAVIIPTKSSLDKIQYNLSEKSRVASSSA